MITLYSDASALVRAYMPDEVDPTPIRRRIEAADTTIVTSEIVRVEVASAAAAAQRAGRITSAASHLARMDEIFGEDGPVMLLRLRPEAILPRAYRIVMNQRVRTLDAIHLAVATVHGAAIAGDGPLAFLTRDETQAAAARAIGLTVE